MKSLFIGGRMNHVVRDVGDLNDYEEGSPADGTIERYKLQAVTPELDFLGDDGPTGERFRLMVETFTDGDTMREQITAWRKEQAAKIRAFHDAKEYNADRRVAFNDAAQRLVHEWDGEGYGALPMRLVMPTAQDIVTRGDLASAAHALYSAWPGKGGTRPIHLDDCKTIAAAVRETYAQTMKARALARAKEAKARPPGQPDPLLKVLRAIGLTNLNDDEVKAYAKLAEHLAKAFGKGDDGE